MFFQGIRCGKCAHDRAQLTRETGGWVALVITLMLEPVQRVIRLSGSGTMSHGADPWPARIGHGGIRLVCKGKLFFKKNPLQLHMHYTDRGAASHTQENGYTIKNLFQRAGGLQVVVVGSVSPPATRCPRSRSETPSRTQVCPHTRCPWSSPARSQSSCPSDIWTHRQAHRSGHTFYW